MAGLSGTNFFFELAIDTTRKFSLDSIYIRSTGYAPVNSNDATHDAFWFIYHNDLGQPVVRIIIRLSRFEDPHNPFPDTTAVKKQNPPESGPG